MLALAAVGLFFVPGILLDVYSYSTPAVWVVIFTVDWLHPYDMNYL
ncbi:MAG: hypothetical protein IMZ73_02620 [Chloroflexi bacterium]|nr:hypothetical protein [Chloroflexota bacterium]